MRVLGLASLVAIVACGCSSGGNTAADKAGNPGVQSGTTTGGFGDTTGTGSISGGAGSGSVSVGTTGTGTGGGVGQPGGERPPGGGVIVPPRDAGTPADAGTDVEGPDADH